RRRVAKSTVLAEAADGARGDSRMASSCGGRSQGRSCHRTRPEGLSEHVGCSDETIGDPPPFGMLQIEGDRSLSAIRRRKGHAHARRAGVLDVVTEIVAHARALDLDYGCTEHAEHVRARGA